MSAWPRSFRIGSCRTVSRSSWNGPRPWTSKPVPPIVPPLRLGPFQMVRLMLPRTIPRAILCSIPAYFQSDRSRIHALPFPLFSFSSELGRRAQGVICCSIFWDLSELFAERFAEPFARATGFVSPPWGPVEEADCTVLDLLQICPVYLLRGAEKPSSRVVMVVMYNP